MSKLHKLLSRQIHRKLAVLLGKLNQQDHDTLWEFLDIVNQAYNDYEEDRLLLERAMELSSKEIIEGAQERQMLNEVMLTQQRSMAEAAKMSELGKMAGGIAHEINNPLGIINMYASMIAEVAQSGAPDPVAIVEHTQKIENTVTRIARIISSLRNFSRDGSQDPLIEMTVKALIDDTLTFCQQRFKQNAVEMRVKIPDDVKLKCRLVPLSQVLLNLLNNAYDAIAAFEEKWIEIEVQEKNERVSIMIMDCGHGIDPETQEKMFEPFFTTKEIGKGTGLGLAISLSIVLDHKGTLSIDNSVPHTRFVIDLPKDLEAVSVAA